MSNTEFGVSIADELVGGLDELTEECVGLQASRSEVVGTVGCNFVEHFGTPGCRNVP